MNKKTVAVLGGNGFVGQRVLKQLLEQNMQPRCISRTGSRPMHMSDSEYEWASSVEWVQGDGEQLQKAALEGCYGLICLVGAPPIPQLTSKGITQQRRENSIANCKAIELAKDCGITRLAVLGAHLPAPARCDKFGYFLGKRDSLRAAKEFASISGNQACVVQPFLITGRRYLPNGRAVPLDRILGPFAPLSASHLISVDAVAQALVTSIANPQPGFSVTHKNNF